VFWGSGLPRGDVRQFRAGAVYRRPRAGINLQIPKMRACRLDLHRSVHTEASLIVVSIQRRELEEPHINLVEASSLAVKVRRACGMLGA